jgi:hypothetical protein
MDTGFLLKEFFYLRGVPSEVSSRMVVLGCIPRRKTIAPYHCQFCQLWSLRRTTTLIELASPVQDALGASKTAFAMTVGEGLDIKLSKLFAFRPVQLEYLYTRFGNDCPLSVCNNNNQNSFRLKSGVVMSWGGTASK